MKFFFPDSQDFVDPSFDFLTETRSATRVRQRDDRYAHELLDPIPYDGILVSKAVVDGSAAGSGKYTVAQRQRFYRRGVREFFRLDQPRTLHLETIGDCGAFAYVREAVPPYTVGEVADFYDEAGFDYGISVDHVILGYNNQPGCLPGMDTIPADWRDRQAITLELGDQFIKEAQCRKSRFKPLGAAQGWSPASYAESVKALQKMGYDYIAVGGVVPLKTPEIIDVLKGIRDVLRKSTRLHLLGVTRQESFGIFQECGVVSFDSTAPLQRAFKDAKVNYYADPDPFTAVRVPQIEGNPRMMRNIRSGIVDHDSAKRLETASLNAVREYDLGKRSIQSTLDLLNEYSQLHDTVDRSAAYERTLASRAWRHCPCQICKQLGVEVILFRGAERNRRRGFHNLFAFRRQMDHRLNELAS